MTTCAATAWWSLWGLNQPLPPPPPTPSVTPSVTSPNPPPTIATVDVSSTNTTTAGDYTICTPLEEKTGSEALKALQEVGAWNPKPTTRVNTATTPIADELRNHFASLSSPEVCDPHRMMLPVLPSYGLGATLNFLIQPATVAIARNVTLITPPLGKWGFPGGQSAAATSEDTAFFRTFDQFLQPFSTCDESVILGRAGQPDPQLVLDGPNTETCGEMGENSTMCRCGGYNQVTFLRDAMVGVDDISLRGRYLDNATGACSVPMYMSAVHISTVQEQRRSMPNDSIFHAEDSFKHLPMRYQELGPLWFTSYAYAALLRPHPSRLAPLLDRIWGEGGLEDPENKPVLSMHVRLGDVCTSSQGQSKVRDCDRLEYYLREADKMRENYGFKSLYIATDDAETAKQARSLSGKSGWRKIVVGFSEFTAGYSDDALKKGELNLLKMAETIFVDIFLMARGDGFIGKFSSNLDRIVVGLMLGTRDCAPPIVSLDSAWCNPWLGNQKTKKGTFGCGLA
jgi:hypothetical protein